MAYLDNFTPEDIKKLSAEEVAFTFDMLQQEEITAKKRKILLDVVEVETAKDKNIVKLD